MKRIICLILALALAFTLCACGPKSAPESDGRLKIVTTIFPVYDWVRSIMGTAAQDADIVMLLDDGVDLHSYAPTAEDMLSIADCDLFIYVGGESDEWVEGALESVKNDDRTVLCLMDVLGDSLKEEEIVEGMQAEEEHEEGEGHDHEEGPEYDEHIWLSLLNAQKLCKKIAEALAAVDPQNANAYTGNEAIYSEQLQSLWKDYENAAANARFNTVLFGDRFPFRYLTDDLGLGYYAAFVGCSAETEASFETVSFLADKVDELGLPCVLTIEKSDGRIAQTIIENSYSNGVEILAMDSMQSVTVKDVNAGVNYLSIMQSNLEVLEQALGVPQSYRSTSSAAADPTAHDGLDVDLTLLSNTMVYAQVYDMITNPDAYIGKKVKMSGNFAYYHDEGTDADYYACIIQDATACCAQGIEFVPVEEENFPEAKPAENEIVTVTGDFDSYYEGDYQYFTLRNASVD